MALRVAERISLEDASHQLGVAFQQFVQHLAIVYMVAASWALRLQGCVQQLLLSDWLYVYQLIESVHGGRIEVAGKVRD